MNEHTMTDNGQDTGRILAALTFAADRHRGQKRKGGAGEPYINHLIGVADLVWNIGGIRDVDVVIAGILHDTVEDTATTAGDIEAAFGARISGLVMEVTDDKTLPKPERRRLQVEHATSLSHGARLIKLADKISNIGDILDAPPVGWTVAERLAYVNWGKSVIDLIRTTNAALEEMFDRLYRRAIDELKNSTD